MLHVRKCWIPLQEVQPQENRGLKGLCSPLPWLSCIFSWNALVHASFSEDYGWTYLVKLQTFTWGLTQRTWSQQQEQFTYLNKRRQFTWSPCWERKPVQEVFMILLKFQLRIVWQIAGRRHQQRQIIWLQRWNLWNCLRLIYIPILEHSWNKTPSYPHGAEHLGTQGWRMSFS